MTKQNVLLVDDEVLALDLLENFVLKIPAFNLIGKVSNPLQAMEIINSQKIDVLFLDIQMPMLSGINLLKSLQSKPKVVFTTAYNQYAIEAFDLNVVDYLLKPFSFERFLQAVNKINSQITTTQNNNNATEITIKTDGKFIKIATDSILFIEGMREYVKIQCIDKSYLVLERMKNMEQLLPKNFIRCHKSFIVSKDKVNSLQGNLLELQGYKIPISRDKKEIILHEIFGMS